MNVGRRIAAHQPTLEVLALWCFSRALVVLLSGGLGSDIPFYGELARAMLSGLKPYGDVALDHPPLVLLLVSLPATVEALLGYAVAFRAMLVIIDLGVLVLLLRAGRLSGAGATVERQAAHLYIWLGALAFPLLHDRVDLAAALLVLALIWSGLTARFGLSWFLLVLLAGLNLGTLLLWPFWLLAERRLVGTWRSPVIRGATAAAVGAGALALTLSMFGSEGAGFLRYHWSPPPEVESFPASLLLVGHLLGATQVVDGSTGALRLVGPASSGVATAALVLGQLLVVALWALMARALGEPPDETDARGRLAVLLSATLTGLLAFALSSLVMLPQYVLWLVPPACLGLHVVGQGSRWSAAWSSVVVLTVLAFPFNVEAVIRLEPVGVLLLVFRNGMLACLLGWSLHLWSPWLGWLRRAVATPAAPESA